MTLVVTVFLTGAAAAAQWPLGSYTPPPQSNPLFIESFGGSNASPNNAPAFRKAVAACDKAGGCTLIFREGTYRTSAINLTSNMRLQIDAGAVLEGTQNNAANCAPNKEPDGSLGNCTSSSTWPVLPWPSFPSIPSGTPGGGAAPAMQAWIRTYNVTNLEITGGGVLDGGGPWWWCTRFHSALANCPPPCREKEKLEHLLEAVWGCKDAVQAGTVPKLPYVPPRMIHLVESNNIHIHNITIRHSPYWTMHFQYSSNILFEHNDMFNPNNGSFETPNGDGIDLDSSVNALVRENVVDVGDDALCCKSGADWLGRRSGGCVDGKCVGRPTRNVLWIDNEVRNGHGLTLGSDAAGGVVNVTYKNTFLNGLGGPQAVGRRTPPGGIGSAHFKTQRGRGGLWENITW